MINRIQLSDPAVFEDGSEANDRALEALADILRGVGFSVRKKSRNEHTLRVYPVKQNEYPLLNPRFVGGRLETNVLSKCHDPALGLKLTAVEKIPGFAVLPIERFEHGYWYYGVIVSPLDSSPGLSALSPPFRALRHMLVRRPPDAPVTETTQGANKPVDGRSASAPDQERKVRIEKTAVRLCCEHFEKLGYSVRSVERDNVGWDLEATSGETVLRVEVKGLSGSSFSVELTPNEYRAFSDRSESYRLAVVTEALDKPALSICCYNKEKKKWLVSGQIVGPLEVQTKQSATVRCS